MQAYVAIKNSVEGGTPEPFFNSLLACFVVAIFYVIGYFWKRRQYPGSRPGWIKISQIDVYGGRREVDPVLYEKYRKFQDTAPVWKRFLRHLF